MRLYHQVKVCGWFGVICYFCVKRKKTHGKTKNTGRGNPEQQKFSFT